VAPLRSEDNALWTNMVARQLHPSTDNVTDWKGQAWDLFERSGYFSLSGKLPEEFDELRRDLVEVTGRLAQATHLSCQTTFRSDRGIEASFWSLRAYSGTWLGHQLAKLPSRTQPGAALRNIYLRAYETAQHAENSQWLLSYVESHVKWNHAVHLDFARRHSSKLACALPFLLTEGRCDSERAEEHDLYVIGPATRSEKAELWEVMARSRPEAYLEALDLVPSRWDLSEIASSWKGVGIERSRSFYVARRNGKAVAAGIFETGQNGTNLFRLLDGVRLFALDSEGNDAFPALIEHARQHYRTRGKKSFVHFVEEERPGFVEAAGLRSLGPGFIWIASAELLPDFLEHVCQHTWTCEAAFTARRSSRPPRPPSSP
jgi:hypothetical protein